jgi:hypothetical protein
MEIKDKTINDVSIKTSAIVAGIGILIMAIIAPIANFSILDGLIKPDNILETYNNVTASESQFRLSIFLNLIVAILDIIVAWALFIFLKPINKSLSLLAAWFRIIYATLLVATLFYLLNTLQVINCVGIDSNQLHTQVMLSLKNFFWGWDFAMTIFGFHLLLIGYLIFKAGYMKKILGILLIIASIGYLIDGFGKVLSVDYKIEIALYTFVGEIVLIFWLLIKGWKIKSIEQK